MEQTGTTTSTSQHQPIASLDPTEPPSSTSFLKGVVSLIWPYSSSNQSAALLLVEPDYRLRTKKGQVRVQLHGPAARAVGLSHIGIGDAVELHLAGAIWIEEGSHVKTPGRSVDGELLFRRRLDLTISRDGSLLSAVDIDEPPSPERSSEIETPQRVSQAEFRTPVALKRTGSFETPLRLSLPAHSSPLDQAGEEYSLEERPRKRIRTSGLWRYERSSLSPEAETAPETEGAPAAGTSKPWAEPETEVRPETAALPQIQTDIAGFNRADRTSPLLPSSPELLPVESAILPHVSPMASFGSATLRPMESQVMPSDDRVGEIDGFEHEVDSGRASHGGEVRDPVPGLEAQAISSTGEASLEPNAAVSKQTFTDSHEEEHAPERMEQLPVMTAGAEESVSNTEGISPALVFDEKREESGRRNVVEIVDLSVEEEVAPEKKTTSTMPPPGDIELYDTTSRPISDALNDISSTARELIDGDPKELIFEKQSSAAESLVNQPESVKTQKHADDAGLFSHTHVDLTSQIPSTKALEPSSLLVPPPLQPQGLGLEEITPQASQDHDPSARNDVGIASAHKVDLILDHRLPPTPQASSIPAEMANDATTIPKSPTLQSGQDEPTATGPGVPMASRERQTTPQTPSRRDSEVPAVISKWFTSGQKTVPAEALVSSQPSPPMSSQNISLTPTASFKRDLNVGFDFLSKPSEARKSGEPNSRADVSSRPAQNTGVEREKPSGLRTVFSYYVPLSNIEQCLNRRSQSLDGIIDVLAVVTSSSSKAKRAKSGPRDFHVAFHISDTSCFPETVQVQVFRPFKHFLPIADVGDTVLLRGFAVKSRSRQCFLLSGEASAWHVWRFSQQPQMSPARSKRSKPKKDIQECRGPPVELGDEEQLQANALRAWWESNQHHLKEASQPPAATEPRQHNEVTTRTAPYDLRFMPRSVTTTNQ